MPATFTKVNQFAEDFSQKVHDVFGTSGSGADALKIMLTNVVPVQATTQVKADVTEIAAVNGYTGAIGIGNVGTRSGGVVTVVGTSVQILATADDIGPFRYVVLFNDTPSSPAKPVIGWWDYGSSIPLHNGETMNVKFNGAAVGSAGNVMTVQ